MESYDTVTAAVNGLKARGFTLDFNLAFDKLKCDVHKLCLEPHEFEIIEVYRFEGDSNPSDEDVVYAVESIKGDVKGVITTAYGMYADTVTAAMLNKLSMHKS